MTDAAAGDEPELTAAQREQLVAALDRVDLRPSLLSSLAPETLKGYRRRFAHYARWCLTRDLQPTVETVDSAKVSEYVRDQILLGRLRPKTLELALCALLFHTEKAGVPVPDVRQARTMVNAYMQAFKAAGVPPAYRVLHRDKRPRARRRTAVEGI